jgi:hypothetical protein
MAEEEDQYEISIEYRRKLIRQKHKTKKDS